MKRFLTLMLAVALCVAATNPASGQQVVPQPEISTPYIDTTNIQFTVNVIDCQVAGFAGKIDMKWGANGSLTNTMPTKNFEVQDNSIFPYFLEQLTPGTLYSVELGIKLNGNGVDTAFKKQFTWKTDDAQVATGITKTEPNEMRIDGCVVQCPAGSSIRVTSILGETMIDTRAENDITLLKLSSFPEGAYVVRVTNLKTREVKTKTIVSVQ